MGKAAPKEGQTAFLDRMWASRAEEVSGADLRRYLEEAPSMQTVAPAVRTVLRGLANAEQAA